jgi:hypothetical protein
MLISFLQKTKKVIWRNMIRSGEEILADIDATLDHLIENAEVMKNTSIKSICESEIAALQKTQESLLARLIHMDQLLDSEQKKIPEKVKQQSYSDIHQKLEKFGRLNVKLINSVTSRFADKPKVRKNRKKKSFKA